MAYDFSDVHFSFDTIRLICLLITDTSCVDTQKLSFHVKNMAEKENICTNVTELCVSIQENKVSVWILYKIRKKK